MGDGLVKWKCDFDDGIVGLGPVDEFEALEEGLELSKFSF